jgi:hypothetical protein
LREHFTPPKLKIFEIEDKSNGGYKKNNYFNKESKGLFMEIIP